MRPNSVLDYADPPGSTELHVEYKLSAHWYIWYRRAHNVDELTMEVTAE